MATPTLLVVFAPRLLFLNEKQSEFKVNLFFFCHRCRLFRSFISSFTFVFRLRFLCRTNEASHDTRRADTHTLPHNLLLFMYFLSEEKKNVSVSDIWVSSRFVLYNDYILYKKTRLSIGQKKNVIEISLWYRKVFVHCLGWAIVRSHSFPSAQLTGRSPPLPNRHLYCYNILFFRFRMFCPLC